MSNPSQWNVSDASNNSAAPNGAPEGMSPSSVNDTMRAMMGGIARWYSDFDGTLATGGAGNAYTLTTNSTHTALADQPALAFRINRANTGAATLNVDSLGAKSLRKFGQPLVSGDLIADVMAIAVYNATDDAYDLIGGFGTADLNVTGTTAVDLVDNDNPLNIGTESGAHLAFDTNSVQAKATATTSATLNLNELGGSVSVGPQSGTGSVSLFRDGALAASTEEYGLSVQDTSGGDPAILLKNDAGTSIALVQAFTGSSLVVRNSEAGYGVELQGRNVGDSANNTLFDADPDGAANLYYGGAAKLATSTNGIDVSGTLSTITDSSSTVQLKIYSTVNGGVEFSTAAGAVNIIQQTSGGSDEDTWINMVRNGAVTLYHNNSAKIATTSTGIDVTGIVDFDWAGYSAMTAAPVGTDEFLYNDGGTIKTMSYNETALPSRNVGTSGNFASTDCGTIVYWTGTTGTLTMPTGVGQDDTFITVVNSGSGTVTLAGSGVTVNSANSLLDLPAGGVAVLIRESSTVWFAGGALE